MASSVGQHGPPRGSTAATMSHEEFLKSLRFQGHSQVVVVPYIFTSWHIIQTCVYLISGLLLHICDFNGCLQRRPANPGKVPSSGSGSTIGSSIGATRKMSKKAGKNFDPKLGVNRNQVLFSLTSYPLTLSNKRLKQAF